MFQKKTREKFVEEMTNKFGGKYELVGKYGNMNTSTEFKNTETGEIFSKTPIDLMRM